MKINQKSPIVDTQRAILSVPAGYLTRQGTEESEINLPLESVRCSRRASIDVQEQRESTLLVGSWIIIVPRKHNNLYRKNRFLVARIGWLIVTVRRRFAVQRKPSFRNHALANFIIHDIHILNCNEYPNMNIRAFHWPACFLPKRLERISVTAVVEKKVKLRLSSDNILLSSSPSVFRKLIQNSSTLNKKR